MKHTLDRKQAGFVLTLEMILVITILGIGIIVGVVAVRDALFKKALSIQNENFYVFDSTQPDSIAIGKVWSFDEHEAPIVPFIDYDPLGNGANFRALVGVRDDRFTSRQPIFYTGALCTGDPCIAGPSSEVYNFGIDNIETTGGVGYVYALQGITYGIGVGAGGAVKGRLYRQVPGPASCTAQSVWESQRVVDLIPSPCSNLPAPLSGLYPALSVDHPTGGNVLDPLVPPFFTNMTGTPSTTYFRVPADGEG